MDRTRAGAYSIDSVHLALAFARKGEGSRLVAPSNMTTKRVHEIADALARAEREEQEALRRLA